ncbi:alternate-type signal peptide domain-containing protein [Citricoccus alkalitolerans]|uniref:Alternate-type signal peptide domain-containing protein n=1 Tax=Citricoccus alkalitolerans TaxID=246603 RepID=A0ABV8XUM9_9MICC
MKKMTKGAIVTGLGVALLLGGGGTLAVWNTSQTANAGSISTGAMSLTPSKGVWTTNLSQSAIPDISAYRMVPGEKLTYTQDVAVGLEGDHLTAALSVDTDDVTSGFTNNLKLESFAVTPRGGTNVLIDSNTASAPVEDGSYTASATLAFNANGIEDMSKTLDLSQVRYVLDQQAPQPVR